MWSEFLSLFFPEYCLACLGTLESGEKCICTRCRYHLPKTNSHLEEIPTLTQKFWGRTPVRYTWAYLKFSKGSKVQRLLNQLKYSGQQELGELLGHWYGAELKQKGYSDQFDLILPVPLHESKLLKRGYNQSDCFAKGLSKGMELEWSGKVLERNTATVSQTKKGRWERWQNVEEIFEVVDEEKVRNKRILLVDDVITTGATLEACAIELYNKGCASVSIATLAAAQ